MVRRKQPPKQLLTDVELELMQALWDRGSAATIKEVWEALPRHQQLAYTSVATVMNILEKKKFIGREKGERAHLYFPLIAREDYEAKTIRHLVDNVFRGAPSTLAARLLSENEFTAAELESLRALLETRLKP